MAVACGWKMFYLALNKPQQMLIGHSLCQAARLSYAAGRNYLKSGLQQV